MRKSTTCSVFEVELWGIFDRLNLLQDRGLNRLSIHTDSLEVVLVLQRSFTTSSSSAWMVSVDMEGINVLAFAPTYLLVFLESDKVNGSFDCIN
ncbi:hypothetical protein Gohar_026020, partial [Gossypium harknessii]|nr:hypothetical protein [Gossypium harknessii]